MFCSYPGMVPHSDIELGTLQGSLATLGAICSTHRDDNLLTGY